MKTKYSFLLVAGLLLGSCATILTQKTTQVKVITPESSQLVVDGDTLSSIQTEWSLSPERSPYPLSLTVLSPDGEKTVDVKARSSFAYYLNIYPLTPFWMGFWIDTWTNKRYTYPHIIYIDSTTGSDYLTYLPLKGKYADMKNILKINPVKFVGLINPSFELAYERKLGTRFSSQFMASFLINNSISSSSNKLYHNKRGGKFGIEERFYYKKSAMQNGYIGLEGTYLNSNYQYIGSFNYKNDTTSTNPWQADYLDSIDVSKNVWAINFKVGHQFIYKSFVVDLNIGLGVKHREVSHQNRINPEDYMTTTRHPSIVFAINNEANYYTLSMPLTIRLGWLF